MIASSHKNIKQLCPVVLPFYGHNNRELTDKMPNWAFQIGDWGLGIG